MAFSRIKILIIGLVIALVIPVSLSGTDYTKELDISDHTETNKEKFNRIVPLLGKAIAECYLNVDYDLTNLARADWASKYLKRKDSYRDPILYSKAMSDVAFYRERVQFHCKDPIVVEAFAEATKRDSEEGGLKHLVGLIDFITDIGVKVSVGLQGDEEFRNSLIWTDEKAFDNFLKNYFNSQSRSRSMIINTPISKQ